jgi:hypothetical protein
MLDKYLDYLSKTISKVMYCVVLFNKSSLTARPDYDWYTLPFAFVYHNFFPVAGPNLGIPDGFTSSNGFDGNCLAGVRQLGIGQMSVTTIFADLQTFPV